MSSFLARFWNLRRSPNPSDRLTWWLVVLGSIVIVLIPAFLEVEIFLLLWYGLALLLTIVPAVWGFYHRQAVWEAVTPARNWAGAVSLLNTLVFYSLAQQKQIWSGLELDLELFTFGAFLLVFCIVFLILFILQMVGACIGIMAGNGLQDLGEAARRGTHAWGLSMLFFAFLPGFDSQQKLEGFYLFLKCSVPISTLILCLLARTPEFDPHVILMRSVRWMERRLILRWDRVRSVMFFDFRGAALGGLAGVMAILMSVTDVFDPMQLQTLGPLIRLRNSNSAFKFLHQPETALTNANQIVLVQFDPSTRNQMLSGGSETEIQTAAINRLTELDAGAIILPMPLLELEWLRQRESSRARTDYEAPQPDEESIDQSNKDLPVLIEAVTANEKVILATHGSGSQSKQLTKVIEADGDATLDIYKIGNIKKIPTLFVGSRPLPYLIAQRLDPGEDAWNLPALRDDEIRQVRVDGRDPDPLIINYQSVSGNRQFPRTTYSMLLQTNMASMYVIPPHPQSGGYPKDRADWLADGSYFKDKIVFLDSIAWHEQQTPIGHLAMPELQAHAALTLANKSFIQLSKLPVDLIITVLFGLLAGHLCLRRDPFRASWRIVLAAFVLVMGIVLMFVIHLIWIDPVLPLIAATLAFMLVTQFTFSLEHVELKRNRELLQRFVAPQVVEELLENPDQTLGLGGSRQNICVLFADVRNFTPYAEHHTSEEVIETINAYMTALTEALHAYGGLLDKYTGDGLMALFRVTHDPPNEQIQEAVLAALAMRDVCKTVSKRLVEQEKQPLEVGISLHYGEAVVGLVGNPNQFNYTALGHTVVVASRLNSVTPAGDVLVSDTVYQAIADTFVVEECDEVMVKGLSQPVRPYRVIKPHLVVKKTRLSSLLSGD